jgi:hypothetical protein
MAQALKQNGGDRLYLGTGGEALDIASAIDVVGGKYFTNLLDHVHGTLSASSAIIVDANSKIDILNIDNITIYGNTISSTNTNGNIVLDPNGTCIIKLDGPVEFSGGSTFTGVLNADGGIAVDTTKFTVDGTTGAVKTTSTLEVDGESTLASAIVEDLTATRIVYAGTGGALVDDSGLTYTGSGVNATLQILGRINVDVEATLASAVVEDLTATRIVLAGTGGALEDNSKLTFNGTTLRLTADYSQTGTGTVTGQWNVDNLRLDGNVISSTDTNGNITLTPNGTGYVVISGTNGLVIPSGTNAQQAPSVTGAIRYNMTNTQFEGYSGNNWSSLGGVRSVDGFTYIIAESAPAASDNILHFYASNLAGDAGVEVAQLDITSLRLLQTTIASSTATGALVVSCGAGIAGNLHVGGDEVLTGDLAVNGGDITTSATTFNLLNATATTVNAFGAATAINIGFGGESDGLTTIKHDVKLIGDLNIGPVGTDNFTVHAGNGNTETAGNLIVGGDLTVNGTTTSVNTNTLDVEDALIRLASGNTSDTVDIGFIGRFNDGTDKFAGVFRDATTDEFYIFSELVDADLTDNVIDRSSTSFKLSAVNVDTIKFASKAFTLTGDVSGTINISDFGTTAHSMAVTIQPNSVELGTDTTGNYVATIVQATTDTNDTTNNGIVITGSGSETAAVTIKANLASTAGAIGTSTYDATNFDVSAGGLVTIDTIDGGTF